MSSAKARRAYLEVEAAIADKRFSDSAKYKYLIKREIRRENAGKESSTGYEATQDVAQLGEKEAGGKMRCVLCMVWW
jgi:hypothetical protein